VPLSSAALPEFKMSFRIFIVSPLKRLLVPEPHSRSSRFLSRDHRP
jgi:hypothetical protein